MKLRSTSRLGLAVCLGGALAAFAALGLASPPSGGFSPDPAGHATKKQWVFDIAYRGGKCTITQASSVVLNNPTGTARVIGRFAVELWVGKELLDRVRFDVPLLDDDPTQHRKGPFSGPRFSDVTTRLKARMADSPRATYVVLLDRATGDEQRFWWPPEPDGKLLPMASPTAGSTADAAVPGDGGRTEEGGTGAEEAGAPDAPADAPSRTVP